jgi:hypothetical protein
VEVIRIESPPRSAPRRLLAKFYRGSGRLTRYARRSTSNTEFVPNFSLTIVNIRHAEKHYLQNLDHRRRRRPIQDDGLGSSHRGSQSDARRRGRASCPRRRPCLEARRRLAWLHDLARHHRVAGTALSRSENQPSHGLVRPKRRLIRPGNPCQRSQRQLTTKTTCPRFAYYRRQTFNSRH